MTRSRFRRPLCSVGLSVLACLPVAASASPAQAVTAPRTVNIVVVPSLAGVHFTLDGIPAVTGPGGTATMADSDLVGAAQHLAIPQQQLGPDLRVSLDRVSNNPNHGEFSRLLVAELDEDRAVSIKLLTPQRTYLPFDHVTAVTLNDSLGRTTQISHSQLESPVWLAASRPAQVKSGITGRLVTYSVKSVMIRGTNVVNSGQLRFTTNRSLTWDVPVILHSLTINANDLLAGAPAGTSVKVTYPNQTTVTVPLGPGHRVTLTDLPRGSYGLRVIGGLVPLASTVHLSKDQTATEIVVTAGDVVEALVLVSAMLAVVAAAGIIGRRRRHMRNDGAGDATVA
jgi:hypothetical protein